MSDGDVVLETPRLKLRLWQESDRTPFARMNADPRVMEFFPKCLTREESDAGVDRILAHFQRFGFGLYAAQFGDENRFIGYVGLAVPSFNAPFTPCVEIGWRLEPGYWGQGLATEGARGVVTHAFDVLAIPDLVSFTVPSNVASRRVMEKIGMRHSLAGDFDHPLIPEGHPLRLHVLYRMNRSDAWH